MPEVDGRVDVDARRLVARAERVVSERLELVLEQARLGHARREALEALRALLLGPPRPRLRVLRAVLGRGDGVALLRRVVLQLAHVLEQGVALPLEHRALLLDDAVRRRRHLVLLGFFLEPLEDLLLPVLLLREPRLELRDLTLRHRARRGCVARLCNSTASRCGATTDARRAACGAAPTTTDVRRARRMRSWAACKAVIDSNHTATLYFSQTRRAPAEARY